MLKVYMKVVFYSAKDFELPWLKAALPENIEAAYIRESLSIETTVHAEGHDGICIFNTDEASAVVIRKLALLNVKFIVLRSSGYDKVDLQAAHQAGIHVYNVPGYSPHAIAEHTTALLLALSRKLLIANEQVHRQNFKVDNLVGFDLYRKKVGIIGTGRIGSCMAKIMHGFGCTVLAYDINRDTELEKKHDVYYAGLRTICSMADIITLHLPLTDLTYRLIEKKLIQSMKRGVILVNTARGAIVNTHDLIWALESGQLGGYASDVYENEKGIFYQDLSGTFLNDLVLKKLLCFKNVILTPHQAFATKEALKNIADGVVANCLSWQEGKPSPNEITSIENHPGFISH